MTTEIQSPQPAPAVWTLTDDTDGWMASHDGLGSSEYRAVKDANGTVVALVVAHSEEHWDDLDTETPGRLIAAAPELLAACINARDMLATDRQAFVDCQQLRDSRTDDPIAHGLVAVEDGAWLDSDDAEALRDYDRAIELIDKATAKATGAQA